MIPYMDLQDLCYRDKKKKKRRANTLIMQNFKLIKRMMKEHWFFTESSKGLTPWTISGWPIPVIIVTAFYLYCHHRIDKIKTPRLIWNWSKVPLILNFSTPIMYYWCKDEEEYKTVPIFSFLYPNRP